VPGLEQALGIDHPDVLGVCLCGAGPSVVAFARERLGEVEKVMEDAFREAGVGYQIRRLKVHPANVSASMSLPVLTCSSSL
jgi:homoserine kinase